ncbi:hypothetical protein GWI34_02945 [Actinomadura sp. DSM 109109]|nr:hypothetical protein [Actinomadura lepetitiana]
MSSSLLVAAAAAVLSASLTAFTPSPDASAGPRAESPSAEPSSASVQPRRDPSDPAAVKGYLSGLQRGAAKKQRECVASSRDGKTTRWCMEPIDPAKAPEAPPPSKIKRAAADPTPPALCAQKPGQTSYDRFHACYEGVGRLVNEETGVVGAIVRFDVWATLSAKNPTWLMQAGVTATNVAPELVAAVPSFVASLACDAGHCELPAPVEKKIVPNTYTYYELATQIPSSAPGDNIQYTNPQVKLTLKTQNAWPGANVTNPLNDPFNIRCDKETYIGGHGCVYYMGNAAAGTFYIDYAVADPKYGDYREVVKHNLYAIEVRDNLKHYGHISYGNPLHRADPITHENNRRSICTQAIRDKASGLGLSCDEYPFASSEEGGTQNPRYSCAFLLLDENSNHGNALENSLYKPNRILPALNEGGTYIQGDPYWVWVLNRPSTVPTVKQCSQY